MAEYIERDEPITTERAAIWFENRAKNTPMPGAKRMFELAGKALREKANAADVVEVRHGHWNTTDTILGRCCECSVCGSCPTMEYRYCPYCGANMDGKGEGE